MNRYALYLLAAAALIIILYFAANMPIVTIAAVSLALWAIAEILGKLLR